MAIPLRTDLDATTVRAVARKSKDGAQARRLLALAAILTERAETGWMRRGSAGLHCRSCGTG